MTHNAYDILGSVPSASPLVVDSPHSWCDYPADFAPSARREDLLTSWDAFVDELFGSAVGLGATMVRARFPRFYLDVNRARDDVDTGLIEGVWPEPANPTKRSAVGMGLIRRLALPGIPVYADKLSVEAVQNRIKTCYDPYMAALGDLIEQTHRRFGLVVHLDCHSMKSRGNAMNDDPGCARPDIVVSDRDGATSAPEFTDLVARLFREAGYSVGINDPYKGGELVSRFSDPAAGRHSIQIELNRALYMDEGQFVRKSPGFEKLKGNIGDILGEMSGYLRERTLDVGSNVTSI